MFTPATLTSPAGLHAHSKFMCINCAFGERKADGLTIKRPTEKQIDESAAAGYREEDLPFYGHWGEKLNLK